MNNLMKSALAVISMTALIAGPASANVTKPTSDTVTQSAMTSSDTSAADIAGAALLFGWTDSQIAANAEQLASLSFDDMDKLANLFTARN